MEVIETKVREEKIRIEGMTCENCAGHVREALTSIGGVVSAEVNLSQGEAVVRYDVNEADLPTLHKAVVDAGYRVVDDGARGGRASGRGRSAN
ncbi:MAG: heavy-metal-associated domain-containing protein [bacterium]